MKDYFADDDYSNREYRDVTLDVDAFLRDYDDKLALDESDSDGYGLDLDDPLDLDSDWEDYE